MVPKDSKEYIDWFKKGDRDLGSAIVLFNDGDYLDSVGYHLHQSIEKYLKGFLLYYNYDYPFIHDLKKLLEICAKFDKHILDYTEECIRMNGYFIEVKYPSDEPKEYNAVEIKKSISMTEFIIKYISKVCKNT